MALIMNDMGEFVSEPDFDPDLRRSEIYASCRKIIPKRINLDDDKPERKTFKATIRRCDECGKRYEAQTINQKFCSQKCQRTNYARKRRLARKERQI